MERTNYVHRSSYFYGNKISPYGLENGRVDYATLSKSFDAVLANEFWEASFKDGHYWEMENGFIDNSEEIKEYEERIDQLVGEMDSVTDPELLENIQKEIDELTYGIGVLEEEEDGYDEIYQYYIISGAGAQILEELTDEIVFYNEEYDLYIWGVTHWGTSWDYVLTNIKVDLSEEVYE